MENRELFIDEVLKYLQAIKRCKTDHSTKPSLTIELVEKELFRDYNKLLSKLSGDIATHRNKLPKPPNGRNFTYRNYDLEKIINILKGAFELEPRKDKYRIKYESVQNFFQKSTEKQEDLSVYSSSDTIFLTTSTYQKGKDFEIQPKGIFKLNFLSKKANLFYYKNGDTTADSEIFDGRVEHENNLIYITFPAKNPKKMYILQAKTVKDWKTIKYLRGTYISDSETHPEAGVVFCEKVDSQAHGLAKLGEKIPIEIQHELLHKQFKINEAPITDDTDMEEHPMHKYVNKIKDEFSGTYLSFYLSTQSQKSILKSMMTVSEYGKVKFYTGNDQKSSYDGYVIAKSSDTLYVRVTYQRSLNTHKFFMTLRLAKKDLFIGAYGGDFQDNRAIPSFGRVVFIKIPNSVNTSEEPYTDAFAVDRKDQMERLRTTYFRGNEATILDFLRGISNVPNYYDVADSPYHVFKDTELSLDTLDTKENSVHQKNGHQEPYQEYYDEAFVAPYVGLYESYVISHFNDDPKYRLQCIKIEIKKDGKVIVHSQHNIYTGLFYYDSSANCIILTIQRNKFDIIKHTLEKIPNVAQKGKNDLVMLRGTYTGVGVSNSPIGGRILLVKQASNNITPSDFPLSGISDEGSSDVKDYLLPFFMGMRDNMVESYHSFFSSDLLPRFFTEKQSMDSVTGLYKVYRLRNNRKSISIVPLAILPDGTVYMKSGRSQNGKFPYAGKIVLTENEMVSILFCKRGENESFAYAMFNKSTEPVGSSNNTFIGVFTSWMPHDKRVFSSRIVLVFQDKSTEQYDDIQPVEVFTPTWGEPVSDAFAQLDAHGIMTYLSTEENNMIRTGQGPKTRSLRLNNEYKKKFDYGKVFFIAAVQALKEGDKDEAQKLWQHAKDQGFIDRSYLDEVISKEKIDPLFFENK